MNCINNPWIGCFSLDNGHIPTPFKLLSSTHFTKCPNINNVSLYKLDFVITKCELSNLFAVSNNFLISETMERRMDQICRPKSASTSDEQYRSMAFHWFWVAFIYVAPLFCNILPSFRLNFSSLLTHFLCDNRMFKIFALLLQKFHKMK